MCTHVTKSPGLDSPGNPEIIGVTMSDDFDDDKTGAERRVFERIPAKVEVRFNENVAAAKAFQAYSLNFSAGGLCVRTKRAYEHGEQVDLTLQIQDETFTLEGVVSWIRGDVIGVRFEKVSKETRLKLQEVVEVLKENLKTGSLR